MHRTLKEWVEERSKRSIFIPWDLIEFFERKPEAVFLDLKLGSHVMWIAEHVNVHYGLRREIIRKSFIRGLRTYISRVLLLDEESRWTLLVASFIRLDDKTTFKEAKEILDDAAGAIWPRAGRRSGSAISLAQAVANTSLTTKQAELLHDIAGSAFVSIQTKEECHTSKREEGALCAKEFLKGMPFLDEAVSLTLAGATEDELLKKIPELSPVMAPAHDTREKLCPINTRAKLEEEIELIKRAIADQSAARSLPDPLPDLPPPSESSDDLLLMEIMFEQLQMEKGWKG